MSGRLLVIKVLVKASEPELLIKIPVIKAIATDKGKVIPITQLRILSQLRRRERNHIAPKLIRRSQLPKKRGE